MIMFFMLLILFIYFNYCRLIAMFLVVIQIVTLLWTVSPDCALVAALAHSVGEVAGERGQLLEKRRHRRAMETLLEHGEADERLHRGRMEIKRIDEMAARRWIDNTS